MFKSGIDNCRNKEALIYKCVTILIRLYLNSHIPCVFVKIQIIDDADLDNDGQLSLAEFDHVMGKTPEFAKYVQYCISYNSSYLHVGYKRT